MGHKPVQGSCQPLLGAAGPGVSPFHTDVLAVLCNTNSLPEKDSQQLFQGRRHRPNQASLSSSRRTEGPQGHLESLHIPGLRSSLKGALEWSMVNRARGPEAETGSPSEQLTSALGFKAFCSTVSDLLHLHYSSRGRPEAMGTEAPPPLCCDED